MSKPGPNIPQAEISQYVAQLWFYRNNYPARRHLRPAEANIRNVIPDNDTQEIITALDAQDTKRSVELIRNCKNNLQARLIFSKLLDNQSSSCLLAFIKNRTLNDELTSRDLYSLLNRCDELFEQAPPEGKRYKNLEKIGLRIARDSKLARRLGYHLLLTFANKNKALGRYCASHENFLMSLDVPTIQNFYIHYPEHAPQIKATLNLVLQQFDHSSRQYLLASHTLSTLEEENDVEDQYKKRTKLK